MARPRDAGASARMAAPMRGVSTTARGAVLDCCQQRAGAAMRQWTCPSGRQGAAGHLLRSGSRYENAPRPRAVPCPAHAVADGRRRAQPARSPMTVSPAMLARASIRSRGRAVAPVPAVSRARAPCWPAPSGTLIVPGLRADGGILGVAYGRGVLIEAGGDAPITTLSPVRRGHTRPGRQVPRPVLFDTRTRCRRSWPRRAGWRARTAPSRSWTSRP